MGYFLTYEGMLESVIYARDKWLRPAAAASNSGAVARSRQQAMYPSRARVFLSAFTEHDAASDAQDQLQRERSIAFWSAPVYGFDFSPLAQTLQRPPQQLPAAAPSSALASASASINDAQIELLPPQRLLGARAVCVKDFELSTVTVQDLRATQQAMNGGAAAAVQPLGSDGGWRSSFSQSMIGSGMVDGFVSWFDVEFPAPAGAEPKPVSAPAQTEPSATASSLPTLTQRALAILAQKKRKLAESSGSNQPIVLSTSPEKEPTHWQQTLFYLDQPIAVKQDDVVSGTRKLPAARLHSVMLTCLCFRR
jgi:protein arginine N-methyltransferase 6